METTPTKIERNARIVELYKLGMSNNKIAFKLVDEGFEQISPQRVNVILQRELELEA